MLKVSVTLKTGHMFQPVIISQDHRWNFSPIDLKFDAKWTHQPGSVVNMWPNEMISVSVVERQVQGKFNGMRFATDPEWIGVASGRTLRISLTTRASKTCWFRAAYVPRDFPHSGFHSAKADKKASTMSFEFDLREGSESPSHFTLFEPLSNNIAINIIDAHIQIL